MIISRRLADNGTMLLSIVRLPPVNRTKHHQGAQPGTNLSGTRRLRSHRRFRGMIALAGLLGAMTLPAHNVSDAHIDVSVREELIVGHWEIAIHDLHDLLDLDTNTDGAITWGEMRSRQAEIANVALRHLSLRADGRPLAITINNQKVADRPDGNYVVLEFEGELPRSTRRVEVDYRLLFDRDPLHRAQLRFRQSDRLHTAELGPASRTKGFDLFRPEAIERTPAPTDSTEAK